MNKAKLNSILHDFFIPKIKFATASLLSTIIDVCLFTFLLVNIMEPINADRIAAGVGMLLNFYLQKRYVFDLKRNSIIAFGLSLLLSVLAVEMGAQIINLLTREYLSYDFTSDFAIQFHNPFYWFFLKYIIVAKVISIGVKFVFNFYTKRWVFQREKISLKKYSGRLERT